MRRIALIVSALWWVSPVGALPPPPPEDAPIPPAAVGSLAIRAVKGESGGLSVAGAEARVKLYHRGVLVRTIDVELDDHGVSVIDALPLDMDLQPVVEVAYANMTYQTVGATMSAAHPQQTLEVVCYDTTDEVPAWSVNMRHVMIDRAPQGLRVMEVIVVENPADRTWLGLPGVDDKRITTSFTLPPDAAEVVLGPGFHDSCCTSISDRVLINHLPLMPRKTEFKFSYFVPATEGTAKVEIAAPTPVDHLMVIVPEQMSIESTERLELGGTQQMGDMAVRYYMTSGLSEGQLASVTVAGLTGATARAEDGSAAVAKIAAAIGGGVLLLLAAAIMISRSPKPEAARALPNEG